MIKRHFPVFILFIFLYVYASAQQEVLLAPIKVNKQWGYINSEGTMVISPRFEDAKPFSEGMAACQAIIKDKNGVEQARWGYIDKTGKYPVEPKYFYGGDFHEGFAAVTGKNWAYINKKGEEVIMETGLKLPAEANIFSDFCRGYGYISLYEMPDIFRIDTTGHLIKTTLSEIPDTMDTSGGMVVIDNDSSDNLKYGFKDTAGKIMIPPVYLSVSPFSEGISIVATGERWLGGIDKKGKLLFELEGNRLGDFHEGLAYFADLKTDIYGFVNKRGELVIKGDFVDAGFFSNGLCWVESGGKYGYINRKGKMVIPLQFDSAGEFRVAE